MSLIAGSLILWAFTHAAMAASSLAHASSGLAPYASGRVSVIGTG